MGTYTMKISLVFVLWIYGNTVTDGLSNDNIHITGPESFITDGSRNLTLTCLATDAGQDTGYNWYPSSFTCVDYIQNIQNCTLIPRLDQDNKTIICTAISPQGPPSQARYTFNLKYPPQAAPVITSSRLGQILQDGDTVTCTVTGGKPPVADVTLSCTNPDVTSKSTTISTDGSVSSSVTVNIAGATEDGMECTCTATWEPEPGLYTLNNETFLTQFYAKVKNFTVNGSSGGLTVNENDTNVIFHCEGAGRPAPNVSITSSSGSENVTQDTSRQDTTTVTTYLIPLVSRSDMGSYTCLAKSGISEEKSLPLQLNVLCAPRLDVATNSRENPATLKISGISFNVTAYPVPDNFRFMFLGKERDMQEDVPQGRFKMRAQPVEDSSEVTCTLTPIYVPANYLSKYSVKVSNRLGAVLYYFRVDEAEIPREVVIVFGTAVVACLAPIGFFIAVAERMRQAIAVPLWIVFSVLAAVLVLVSVIVAAVSKGLIPIVAFSLMLATAVVNLIVATLVLVGVMKAEKQAGAVPWWIYLLGAITPVAAVVALVLVAVYADTLQLYQRSFGIIISCIVLDAVVAAMVVITVFIWRRQETPSSVKPDDNRNCATHDEGFNGLSSHG